MNKNKWLLSASFATISLSVALALPVSQLKAEDSQNTPTSLTKTTDLPALAGKDLAPEERFRKTGQLMAFLLMQSHYEHPEFSDSLSKEAFKQLVKMMDPNRSYFLAEDVKKFKAYEQYFDDAIRTGKVELAYDFFELYEKRHRERYLYALEVLKKPLEFKAKEEFQYDRREAAYAKDNKELNEIWRKKVKHDALNLKLAEQSDEEIREKLSKRYKTSIRRLSQTTSEDVFGYFANAINLAIDPHTTYYTPRQFEDFTINMSLKLQGIGAVLTQEDEFTKVVKVVNKGPAQKSKQIHKDDKIIGVGQGDKGEIVDVIGWRNGDVVDLIRGEAGSVVRLQVIPHTSAGDAKTKIVRIVREEIKLEDQAAKSQVIQVEQDGQKLDLGVIELPSFYAETVASASANPDDKNTTSTTKDVRRLIGELKEKNVQGIILDLRNNGGGSLSEVVNLTGLFIDKGPVVQGKDYQGQIRVLKDTDGETFYNGPLAVMVNGGSASASEIFAGAIQDYGRGLVIGDNTFGKGTVQTVADLNRYVPSIEENVGALKFTIEKFYRITGESTQNKGVQPDISFPTAYDTEKFGESSYDNSLAWDTIDSSSFKETAKLGGLFPYLTQQHEQRKKTDDEFSYLVTDINRIVKERNKKSISLNHAERLAKREANEGILLERENMRRKLSGLEPLSELPEDEELDEQSEDEVADSDKDILLKETGRILSDFIKVSKDPKLLAAVKVKDKALN